MSVKKFFGVLMVLAIAIFAFTACSSDDDDEKTGTFEYAIGYSSFAGDLDAGLQKVNDAFMQAFGVTDKSFKLTGTQSECNRKAKEYAMKAQAALANEGSFGATVKFVNVTTGELIHSFTIEMDDNDAFLKANVKLSRTGVTFYGMKGYYVEIVYKSATEGNREIFNDYFTTNEENFDLKALVPDFFLPTNINRSNGCFVVLIMNKSERRSWTFFLEYTSCNGLMMYTLR